MAINLAKIVFDRLNTDSRIIAYPGVTIDWNEAPESVKAPNLIINEISNNSNEIWRRLWIYQISVWENSKLKSDELRDIVIDIFNRWKEGEVKFATLESSVPTYDNKIKEFWHHITFKFKLLDKNF